jgi:hypothetical protein
MSFELSFHRSSDASLRQSFEASDVRSDALSFETSDARSDAASTEMSDGRSDEVSFRVSVPRCLPANSEASFLASFQRSFGLRVSSSQLAVSSGGADRNLSNLRHLRSLRLGLSGLGVLGGLGGWHRLGFRGSGGRKSVSICVGLRGPCPTVHLWSFSPRLRRLTGRTAGLLFSVRNRRHPAPVYSNGGSQ